MIWEIVGALIVSLGTVALLLAFCRGLIRRSNFKLRVSIVYGFTFSFAFLWEILGAKITTLEELTAVILIGVAFYFIVETDWLGAFYKSVWMSMIGELLYETVALVYTTVGQDHYSKTQFIIIDGIASVCVALVLYFTVAKILRRGRLHPVGPRQSFCAIVLMAFFLQTFVNLLQSTNTISQISGYLAEILIQLYCITFLYFQDEVFKKAEMQKELDTLNAMYNQKIRQYDLAKHNVTLMNQYCHNLKVKIASMRQTLSDKESIHMLTDLEKSVNLYADIVHTGDDVLDMVLTEKNLLCRAQQIQINCVADGKLLYFIRPADVYTIFSVAIGNAMQEVAAFPETEKRLIDISIGKRQNFLFINVFNPLFHKENAADPLSRPMEEQPAYELRTIKKIVSDYHGLMKVDVFHDTFSLNIMIPFPQKQ